MNECLHMHLIRIKGKLRVRQPPQRLRFAASELNGELPERVGFQTVCARPSNSLNSSSSVLRRNPAIQRIRTAIQNGWMELVPGLLD